MKAQPELTIKIETGLEDEVECEAGRVLRKFQGRKKAKI
jgi:hypothetical protein